MSGTERLSTEALGLVGFDRLALARRRAERNARLERLWPAILPGLGLIGLYVAASLFGGPQALPDWAHGLLLAAWAVATVLVVRARLRHLPPLPALVAAQARDRRIERASGLRHEPLATLSDRPAAFATPADAALWAAHQRRILSAMTQPRAGWPKLGVARHDPWRLAWVLAILLLAGLVVAGARAPGRVLAGLWPGYQNQEGPPPVVQAWITSPAYTGVAPIFLDTGSAVTGQSHVRVPQGAILTAIVTGPARRPELSGGARSKQLGPHSWTLTRALDASGTLRLSAGGYDLPRWTIEVVPSGAPSVEWTQPPTPAAGDDKAGRQMPALRLPWHVAHPYGVAALEARITPDGANAPVVVPVPLEGHPRDAHGVATADLAANPLAGGDASVVLHARDGAGHAADSAPARVRLPAHAFRNPLARAIQAARRRLALHPDRAAAIADDLRTLGEAPGALQRESDLYLELATAAALVEETADPDRADDATAMRAQAQQRLWDLALSVEDALGNDRGARAASVELRAAQGAVQQQMQRMRELGREGQSPREQSELQRRVDALNQAIRKRMQALADQARRQGNAIPMDPQMGGQNSPDLQKLMQQMQRDAAEGRTDQAMRELQQMQSMLDRMRAATPRDAAAAAMQAQAAAEAREQMDGLHDLVQRQTGLLDGTQKRVPHDNPVVNPTQQWRDALQGDPQQPDQATPPQAPAPDGTPDAGKRADRDRADQAQVQHTLQRATDELAQEFKAFQGKLPQGLTDAGKAMVAARDALRQGDDAAAATAQTEALKDLQQGGQQMQKTMRDNSSKAEPGSGGIIPGFGSGGGGEDDDQNGQASKGGGDQQGGSGAEGGDRDALGRPLGQGHKGDDDATSSVLPGQDSGSRSRALEQELRRRDSDRQRPPAELDYLDRLLKPFAQ